MILYKFCRPYCTHQDRYETLEQAMRRALTDYQTGEDDISSLEIRDGDVVYDHDAMMIYWRERGWVS